MERSRRSTFNALGNENSNILEGRKSRFRLCTAAIRLFARNISCSEGSLKGPSDFYTGLQRPVCSCQLWLSIQSILLTVLECNGNKKYWDEVDAHLELKFMNGFSDNHSGYFKLSKQQVCCEPHLFRLGSLLSLYALWVGCCGAGWQP